MATLGFSHFGLIPDFHNAKHLVLYGRNIVESLMVKEAKAFMAAVANGMRVTYIDPRASATACKSHRYWQVRPNSDYALNLALIHELLKQEPTTRTSSRASSAAWTPCARRSRTRRRNGRSPIPASQPRSCAPSSQEIAADRPRVIFHPGWLAARHKQSFHVSRTTLILNALMGNIEVPGGLVLAKAPEQVGRKSLKRLTSRVPPVQEPRVDGAGTDHPSWDPATGALHQLFAALESGKPYGIGAYFAYRHDPLTSLPDAEAVKHALDKLGLLVSIDVRYSETGWYSDVILPESTYLERANLLAQMPGPVPAFFMRDQAIAPRFDSRPAWWIFREILRRLGVKEALDFETIEELWNWQLEGTGVTIAEMRETGVVPLAAAPKLIPREALKFPTPSGKIEIDSAVLKKAGLPYLPPYRRQDGADGRPLQPAVRPAGDAGAWPVAEQPDPGRDRAATGAVDPPRSRRAAWASAKATWSRSTAAAATRARLKAKVTSWIHPEAVFMLHGYGATVPLATRALGRGVADQRLQHGKLYDFDPAGSGCALTETIVRIKRVA